MKKKQEYIRTATMAIRKTENTPLLLKVLREYYNPVSEICDFIYKTENSDLNTERGLNEFVFGSKKKKRNKETGEIEETEKFEITRGHCNNVAAALFNSNETKNAEVLSATFVKPMVKENVLPLRFDDTEFVMDGSAKTRWKDSALYSSLCRLASWKTWNTKTAEQYKAKMDEFGELTKEIRKKYSDEEINALIHFYNFVDDHNWRIDWKFISFVKNCVENGGKPTIKGKYSYTSKGKEKKTYYAIPPEIFNELMNNPILWQTTDSILFNEQMDDYIHLFMGLFSKEEGGRGWWKKQANFTNVDVVDSPTEIFLNINFVNSEIIGIDNEKCVMTMRILLPPKKGDEEGKKNYIFTEWTFGTPTRSFSNGKTFVNKKRNNRQINDLKFTWLGSSGKYKIEFTNGREEKIVGEISEFRIKLIIHNKNINWDDPKPEDYSIRLSLPYRVECAEFDYNKYKNLRKAYPALEKMVKQNSKVLKENILKLPKGTRIVSVDWGLYPIATIMVAETTGKYGEFNVLDIKKIYILPENQNEGNGYWELIRAMELTRRLIGQTKTYIGAIKDGENIEDLDLFDESTFDWLNTFSGPNVKRDEYIKWVDQQLSAGTPFICWSNKNTGWYPAKLSSIIHKKFIQFRINRRNLDNDLCLLKRWDWVLEDYMRTMKCVYRFGAIPKKGGEKDITFQDIIVNRQNLMEHFQKNMAYVLLEYAKKNGSEVIVMEELSPKFSRKNTKEDNITRKKLGLSTFKRWLVGSNNAKHYINTKYGIMLVEADEQYTSQMTPDGEFGYRNFDQDKTKLFGSNGKEYDADETACYNLIKRVLCQHSNMPVVKFNKVEDYYVPVASTTPKDKDKRIKATLTKKYGKYNVVFKNGDGGSLEPVPLTTKKANDLILLASKRSDEEKYYDIGNEWKTEMEYKNYIESIKKLIK